MSWAKIDDRLHTHPKVLKAGDQAMGLWLRCLSYTRAYKTFGFIPREYVIATPQGEELAARLVQAKIYENGSGLWTETDGGWQFHDFDACNPDEDRDEEISKSRSKSGKKGAAAKRKQIASRLLEKNKQNESKTLSKSEAKGRGRGSVSDPEEAFMIAWAKYPRQKNRAAAFKAFLAHVKTDADLEALNNGIDCYAAEVTDTEEKFIAHMSTFVNQHRWENYTAPAPSGSHGQSASARMMAETERQGNPLDDLFATAKS